MSGQKDETYNSAQPSGADSSLSQTLRHILQIYRASLDYLDSLDRLDAESFEILDNMLEPAFTAMGAGRLRQLMENFINLLPDTDKDLAGGMESLRKIIRENLQTTITALDGLTDAAPSGPDTPGGASENAPAHVFFTESEQPASQLSLPGTEKLICMSGSQVDNSANAQTSFFAISADGEHAREIARSSAGVRFSTFTVSPDRRWLVCTCLVQRNERGDLFPQLRAISIASGKQSVLTSWDEQFQPCYFNPVISPRGDRLVCQFGLRDPYNPDLVIMRLDEVGDSVFASKQVNIVNPFRIGNHSPQFMPDGERVIYFGNFAYEDLLELCLCDPDTAKAELTGVVGERLTENGDGVWHRLKAIAVQPEWEQVFFIRGHTKSSEEIGVVLLSNVRPGMTAKRFQTIGGQRNRISSLQTSPDGRWLAFDADDAIYKIATDGSALQRVSPENMQCRNPAFSPDGANLAFIGGSKLFTLNLSTGALSQLGDEGLAVEAFAWTQQ